MNMLILCALMSNKIETEKEPCVQVDKEDDEKYPQCELPYEENKCSKKHIYCGRKMK